MRCLSCLRSNNIFFFLCELLLLAQNKCYLSTENMYAVIPDICCSSVYSEGSTLQCIFIKNSINLFIVVAIYYSLVYIHTM